MSWKIYSLGSLASCQSIADAAKPKLEAFGYTVAYTNGSTSKGVLSVTIGSIDYSCGMNIANTSSFPTYLMVNDETLEVVIGQTGRDVTTSSQMCYLVVMALLRGTNTKTGESGLFALGATDKSAKDFTNWWGVFKNTADQIYLQRAVFMEYVYSGTVVVANSFVSDLYWGTANYTPGATCAVGSDTFLCLNGCLFAKL